MIDALLQVAMISYAFWQRRYGGAADVLGRTLTVEHAPFTIIGVAPPKFFGAEVGGTFDIALPLGTEPLMPPLRESFLKAPFTVYPAGSGTSRLRATKGIAARANHADDVNCEIQTAFVVRRGIQG